MSDGEHGRSTRVEDSSQQAEKRSTVFDYCALCTDDQRISAEMLRPLHVMRPTAVCLDVGLGNSTLADEGGRIGGQWTIYDASARLPLKRGVGTAAGNEHILPFPDSTFDLVTARSVLSNASIRQVLGETRRVMRPDGALSVAEEVLGDFEGDGVDWYRRLQELRNPLRREVLGTSQLSALVEASGFETLSTIEVRQVYAFELTAWLSHSGAVHGTARKAIRRLLESPPESAVRSGMRVDGDRLQLPVSWAVIHGRPTSERRGSGLVVTLIPVRLINSRIHVYVQSRRAPLLEEPEYVDTIEFPQGHFENGENVGDTALRELAEEAGLKVVSVLDSNEFSRSMQLGEVTVEHAYPSQVVITRGRLNHVSLVYIVEADHGPAPSAVDNLGRWVDASQLRKLVSSARIYPLNVPMFTLIDERLAAIETTLGARK